MANAKAKKAAKKNRLTYLFTGDGTTADEIANATLAADAVTGPLKKLLTSTYADQAAARAALLETKARIVIRPRTMPAAVTTKVSDMAVDVNVEGDGKPKVVIIAPEQAGFVAYIDIETRHSLVD